MGNVDVAELLRQHLAGEAGVPERVAELVGSDPELAPVAQLLAQREEQLRAELQQQEQQEQEDVLRAQEEERVEARRRQVEALRTQLGELTVEVEGMRARFADVAAALGACPTCLGEDRSCAWCRGRGSPGRMVPDREAFDRLVLPAVRLQARLNGRAPTDTDDEPARDVATRERGSS